MTGPYYHVDPQSLEALHQRFGALINFMPTETHQFVQDALEIIYLAAQANCPVGEGPTAGALRDSMDRYIHDFRPNSGIISGKVTMKNRSSGQKVYAWMREKGGTIYPRPGNRIQRLVWVNSQGQVIFARQVTQKGSHYMEGALLQSKGDVAEQGQLMLKKFVNFRD